MLFLLALTTLLCDKTFATLTVAEASFPFSALTFNLSPFTFQLV